MQHKLAIFLSGSGTNARNICQYFAKHEKIAVGLLLSNKENSSAKAIGGQEVLLLKKENDALKLRVLDLERKLKQRVDIREERTYQNLIIALLDYIKGDSSLGIDAHPYFETETQLIDFIAEKYRDYHGLSKSNLSRKIPQIKESFKKQ